MGLRPAAQKRLRKAAEPRAREAPRPLLPIPFAERIGPTALVVGTFDTKGDELRYIRDRSAPTAFRPHVDLSTSGKPSRADVTPVQVAAMHPDGSSAVFSGDRGASVAAMAEAFAPWSTANEHRRGHSAGGSGGTSLATPACARLPLGIAEDHGLDGRLRQCRPLCRRRRHHDDVFGRRRAGTQPHHRAGARQCGAGARRHDPARPTAASARDAAPTRAAGRRHHHVRRHHARVHGVAKRLEADFDASSSTRRAPAADRWRSSPIPACSRRHRHHDDGSRRHADGRRISRRRGSVRRGRSAPACPMSVRSGRSTWSISGAPRDGAAAIQGRLMHVHNPQVTLMRTTREENARMGRWIGERLNRMDGPVRFLLPRSASPRSTRRASPSRTPTPTRRSSRRLSRRCARPRSDARSASRRNINDHAASARSIRPDGLSGRRRRAARVR